MIVFLDIETIPGQQFKEAFIQDAIKNFKAPSDLTKTKALEDLNITDKEQIKSLSKDDAIALWVDELAEEKSKQAANEAWLKTSFDGVKGELVSIAWAIEDDEPECVYRSATILGDTLILSDEADMLARFYEKLSKQLRGRPAFFVGQYIAGFDLKFLYHRSVILNTAPPCRLPFNGRHDQAFYDTQEAWAGFKCRMSQNALCSALRIEGKPDDIDGSKVWEFAKVGNVERVAEYNKDDIVKNREIYKRLNFIDSVKNSRNSK